MILKPDYNIVSIFDIPADELKSRGIKVLLFDLDSTVMPSKSGVFPQEILKLFQELKCFFALAVISNNKNTDYIKKAQAQIDFPIIGNAGKPNPETIVKFLKETGINPQNALMAGDRPLTDILAGKLAGVKTMLVDSITKDEEKPIVRLARKLERLCIRK